MSSVEPLFVSHEEHADLEKMEDACDKDGSYKIDTTMLKRRPRFCLSENGRGDGAHTGALAAFLRLYSGHSFLDEFPTIAVPNGPISLYDVDHVRRAVILQTWSNVRLRLGIREHDIEKFISKYGVNEFSEELNLLAALVAHAEALMDDNRRDFSFSKQVSKLKRQQYMRLMANLNQLLRERGERAYDVCGYKKRHDKYS